jgi:hypothetical protein
MRAHRQWMDITLRLRAGQVYDKSNVQGEGSLAIRCFACPTDKNRPQTWLADPDMYNFHCSFENITLAHTSQIQISAHYQC